MSAHHPQQRPLAQKLAVGKCLVGRLSNAKTDSVLEVIGELGRGTYGIVYKVEDLQSQKHYAMKIATTPQGVQFLEKEERLQSQIDSPFVLPVTGTVDSRNRKDGRTRGTLLPLCRKDLFDRLAKQRLTSEARAQQWLAQLAIGLDDMHSQKVLHRDIKPENILVYDKYRVMFADMGLAATQSDGWHGIAGTVGFMAPEVAAGLAYDEKADIWGLGTTMMYLLYGTYILLHPEQGFNWEQSKQWHKDGILIQETQCLKDMYSADFIDLVHSMIELDPHKRPTAGDIVKSPVLTLAVAEALLIKPLTTTADQAEVKVHRAVALKRSSDSNKSSTCANKRCKGTAGVRHVAPAAAGSSCCSSPGIQVSMDIQHASPSRRIVKAKRNNRTGAPRAPPPASPVSVIDLCYSVIEIDC